MHFMDNDPIVRYAIKTNYIDMPNARIYIKQYADGSTAVTAEDPNGDLNTLSVNLVAYERSTLTRHHIYVPDYSEKSGLPKALVQAGVATLDGGLVRFGPHDAKAEQMKLNGGLCYEVNELIQRTHR